MGESDIILSVIIPVYNTGKYLPQCIDSLISQTLFNLEIIIIDDCSDEDVERIIYPYQINNEIAIIFQRLKAHLGPGGARNTGINLAKGRYIAFCDSDDWVDVDYYEECVKHMEIHGADIGMCSLVRSYDAPIPEPLFKCKYDKLITLTGDVALKVLTKQYDLGINIIPSSVNKIYRKEFLEYQALRFLENTLFEDLLFSFVATLNAKKVICIPLVRYHHYKRSNSIVQSISQKHIDDFCKVFSHLRTYLKDYEKYERYRFNYYKFCEQFYNLIIREIFEFTFEEQTRKDLMAYSFQGIKKIVDFEEYMEYTTAEQLRQHIQPHIKDTKIY